MPETSEERNQRTARGPFAAPGRSDRAASGRETASRRQSNDDGSVYARLLGGEVSIEDVIASDDIGAALALDRVVVEGIDRRLIDRHSRTVGMMITHRVLPKSTLQHNSKRPSGRLSPSTSERLVRVLRARRQASDAFGDSNADAWLETPLRRLEGRTPMQMLGTEAGARAVEQLIGRTVHGFNA